MYVVLTEYTLAIDKGMGEGEAGIALGWGHRP